MQLKKVFILFAFGLFANGAVAQSFLNGDFENNTAVGDQINLANPVFNSYMVSCTGFGTEGNLDIITSATYDGGPEHGNWFVALTGDQTDMLSMTLSAPLTAGNTYTISFWDKADPEFISEPVIIGVSTSPTVIGTTVYTEPTTAVDGIWTQHTFTFTAPNNGLYITAYTPGSISTWTQVDNFTFPCSLNLGPDTTLCAGNTITLNATTANATSYLWQDGSTNPTFTVTTAGQYWARMTSPGCVAADTVNVSFVALPQVTMASTASVCQGSSVVLNATSAGATSYTWDDGTNSATRTVTAAGTYYVTIADNGCGLTDSVIVTANAQASPVITGDSILCTGGGSVTFSANAGYTGYLWTTGATTAQITVLATGTYTVSVTATGGCQGSSSITVRASTGFTLTAVDSNIGCTGVDNGQIDMTVTGGNAPYKYLWTNNESTQNINNLAAGTYTVTVTDQTGCTGTYTAILTQLQPPVLTIDSSFSPACAGSTDGRIYASATGGTPPYQYAWSNGTLTAANLNLPAGAYTVTVTDAGQCTAQKSVALSSTDSVVLASTATNVTCNGAADGKISEAPAGGTPVYTYLWSNGGTSAQIVQLPPATYAVTVTDAHGCSAEQSNIVITQPGPITVTDTASTVACANATNGTINTVVTSGTSPYTFKWSNAANTQNISSLAPGAYTVTITDNNACTATVAATVGVQSSLSMFVDFQNPECQGADNGFIAIHVTDTTAPYTYAWTGGLASGDSVYGLAAGVYRVTVTNRYNCQIDTTVTLQNISALQLQVPGAITLTLGQDTLISATGNGPSMHYNWNPVQGLSCNICANPVAAPTVTTLYTVTGSAGNGCTITDTVIIYVIPDYNLFIPNAFTPAGAGNQYFEVYGNKAAIEFFTISIYDRWGEKVYESNDIDFMWNGTYKGRGLPPSVYVYEIKAVFTDGQAEKLMSGSITLLR